MRAMENRATALNADRKRALQEQVERRVAIGLIGYLAGKPVAWCSVAPRSTFIGVPDEGQDAQEKIVWSVTCFFVHRDHRGQGLAQGLVKAAAKLARRRGAAILEGYAVAEDSPSYRNGGFVGFFEDQGFVETGRLGSRRRVMRFEL